MKKRQFIFVPQACFVIKATAPVEYKGAGIILITNILKGPAYRQGGLSIKWRNPGLCNVKKLSILDDEFRTCLGLWTSGRWFIMRFIYCYLRGYKKHTFQAQFYTLPVQWNQNLFIDKFVTVNVVAVINGWYIVCLVWKGPWCRLV